MNKEKCPDDLLDIKEHLQKTLYAELKEFFIEQNLTPLEACECCISFCMTTLHQRLSLKDTKDVLIKTIQKCYTLNETDEILR